MNPRLTAIAERQGGPFTRGQAISTGILDDHLHHLVRAGALRRLRRGAYVETARLSGLGQAGLHVMQVRAVALALTPRVAFSHVSAAALHRLPFWGVDLAEVHVTRRDSGAARTLAGVHHHVGVLGDDEIVAVEGLPAVRAGRAVVEVAMTSGFEPGLVAADAALHVGLTSRAELELLFDEVRQWPGATSVGPVVAHADGLAESVGESRARALFVRHGLPTPMLQQEILDGAGQLVGRVDFLFPDERLVVEFDGLVKYRGAGEHSSDTVVAEKVREDRLRELGYLVVRLTWTDLLHPERTARRLRAALAQASRRTAAAS